MADLTPSLHSFSKRHWAGKTDGGHRFSSEEWLQKYAAELLSLIPRGGVLVDVGCGACELTTYLARSFQTVYAVDFSEMMLAAARKRLEAQVCSNISLLSGSAEKLPELTEKTDVILSYGMVQYLTYEGLAAHLRSCRQSLKEGGVVCAANVPDRSLRNFYYQNILVPRSGARIGSLRARMVLRRRQVLAYFKRDLLWDGIGNWFSQKEIARVGSEAGFDSEFHDSEFYEYRFHAVLTASRDKFV